jgi:hypothetical protein
VRLQAGASGASGASRWDSKHVLPGEALSRCFQVRLQAGASGASM